MNRIIVTPEKSIVESYLEEITSLFNQLIELSGMQESFKHDWSLIHRRLMLLGIDVKLCMERLEQDESMNAAVCRGYLLLSLSAIQKEIFEYEETVKLKT